MLSQHHRDITRLAIGSKISVPALKVILRANLAQDNPWHQFGQDHFHFDNNRITESNAYIEEQRELVVSSIERGESYTAWRSFGRLIHTAQDFYSHSDYVPRWLSRFNGATPPAPREIDPVSAAVLADPGLHTGRIYHPLDALAFIPFLRKLVLPHLPADSHAHMNHDGPHVSPQWDYVFHASVKRTILEFEKTISRLSPAQVSTFTDL
jgi:hypothetical protein